MKTEAEIAEYWRKELVEALRLVSSPYEIQSKSLPDYVHLPDEILGALTVESFSTLLRHDLITSTQFEELKKFDEYLDRIRLPEDYEDMLIEMQSGLEFKEVRLEALRVLEILGEKYEQPVINAVYVQGS